MPHGRGAETLSVAPGHVDGVRLDSRMRADPWSQIAAGTLTVRTDAY